MTQATHHKKHHHHHKRKRHGAAHDAAAADAQLLAMQSHAQPGPEMDAWMRDFDQNGLMTPDFWQSAQTGYKEAEPWHAPMLQPTNADQHAPAQDPNAKDVQPADQPATDSPAQANAQKRDFVTKFAGWLESRLLEVNQLSGDDKVQRVEGILSLAETVAIRSRTEAIDIMQLPVAPVAGPEQNCGAVPPEWITPLRRFIQIVEQPVPGARAANPAVAEGDLYANTDWNSRLGVPQYRTQSDNLAAPEATCNGTSLAMAIERLGVGRAKVIAAIDRKLGLTDQSTADETSKVWSAQVDAYLKSLRDVADPTDKKGKVKKGGNDYQRPRGLSKDKLTDQVLTEWSGDFRASAQLEDMILFLGHLLGIAPTSLVVESDKVLKAIDGKASTNIAIPKAISAKPAKWETLRDQARKCLDGGGSVIFSLYHKGKADKKAGTHIIAVHAVQDDGFIVDDPYGRIRDDYSREEAGDAYAKTKGGRRDASHRNLNDKTTDDWKIGHAQSATADETKGDSYFLPSAVVMSAFNYVRLLQRPGATPEKKVAKASKGRSQTRDVVATFRQGAQSGGQAVPFADEMGGRFGTDFSDVQAYLGRSSAMEAMGAHAAAMGDSVVFGSAAPNRELVAHELAHVVQARRGGLSARPGEAATRPGDATETQAHALASAAMARPSAATSVTPAAAVPNPVVARAETPATVAIAQMSAKQRFESVLGRMGPKLPGDLYNAILSAGKGEIATSLATKGAALIALQFVGIGEVLDGVIAAVGVYYLGETILDVSKATMRGIDLTLNGQSEADLDEAATELASVAANLGAAAFMALLGVAGKAKAHGEGEAAGIHEPAGKAAPATSEKAAPHEATAAVNAGVEAVKGEQHPGVEVKAAEAPTHQQRQDMKKSYQQAKLDGRQLGLSEAEAEHFARSVDHRPGASPRIQETHELFKSFKELGVESKEIPELVRILTRQEKSPASSLQAAVPREQMVRAKIAMDHYKNANFSTVQWVSHLKGIDFSKSVRTISLKAGTEYAQYQAPGGRQGNYYAESHTTPDELGLSRYAQADGHGPVVLKGQTTYKVTSDVTVLESTAAAIEDTWSVAGRAIAAHGGGIQYFTTNKAAFTPK